MRDVMFQCSDRALATRWSEAGLPAYLFVFSFDFGPNLIELIGDAHGFELPFVWRNYAKVLGSLVLDEPHYARMTDVMSCTWASFVRCGAPKCPVSPPNCGEVLARVPEWPRFDVATSRRFLSLKAGPSVESIRNTTIFRKTDEFPGDDRCDFWDVADLNWRNIRGNVTRKWFHQTVVRTVLV